ncbi:MULTISPECIES: TauD/TfdA family dioxygenase [Streptomyces]|uniref:TauD/TfdA family dioxygenase n=1 Tax=Streptomyces TaxID=1883 RepID=UPI000F556FAF|nr:MULTISPECIES: TauD/TfdA family dioxygenase [unclassified Streptomyces]NEE45017.1 clavaminate synthase [Streptomyces sp. SID8455]RPK88844.1 L-asparagine oxygenase [Streptomyces sp. ADI98-12]WPR52886.1 TauD/TfdA family dioxygenase [Streptomyces sp. S399]
MIQVREPTQPPAVAGGDPTGSTIAPLDDVAITLTPAEREAAGEVFAASARALKGRPLDDEEVLTEAEFAGLRLPRRILEALGRFRRQGNDAGALLIRNMPVDLAPPATPADGFLSHWNDLPVATFGQLAVASTVGDVIAYADEKLGRVVQDITPVQGDERRQENSGTVYLELHTEDGFHPSKPDFITLLCIRPDHERVARTVVGAAAGALPLLSERAAGVLREPRFRLRVSSSFGGGADDLLTEPLPVLSGTAEVPDLLADFHAMDALDEEAGAALEELRSAFLATLRGGVLEAGDLVVVDNRTAIHGRSEFTARYDGTDRWLRRCFAVTDIRSSRADRPAGSRVCHPLRDIGLFVPGPSTTPRIEGPACMGS